MLMDVYIVEDLENLDEWIKKISIGNKLMEGLHENIQRIRDQTQEQILEVERYYNVACLDIIEDESKTKLIVVQSEVQNFWWTFEDASLDEDIRKGLKTKEELLELDTKLEDFAATQIEVSNYR